MSQTQVEGIPTTEKGYDSIVELYLLSKQARWRQELERPTVEALLKQALASGGRLLDMGCGGGFYTTLFLDYADRVHGVDISKTSVEEARKQYASVERATFEQGDARTYSTSESYDAMTALWLFNYASSHEEFEQMCQTAARCLRTGGVLFGINDSPFNRVEDYAIYREAYSFYKRCPDGSSRTPGSEVFCEIEVPVRLSIRNYW